jgi:hypothetical protein
MVWNAISLRHELTFAAGQIDSKALIVPVGNKIPNISFPAQRNRTIKGLSLAYLLMRSLSSNVLELIFTGKTFKLHLV